MHPTRSQKGTWGGWMGWLGLALLLWAVYRWYTPQIERYAALQAQKMALKTTLAQEQATNQVLHKQIRLLEDDPRYVEKIAREQLGLARSGEAVVFFAPVLEGR